jgi:anti-sigma regulatory factor (Ser/Thr protein kinase)
MMDKLVVRAKPEHLEEVQAFVGERLTDCPSKLRNKISIVVDEIFANIASYAYDHPDGDVTVRVTMDGDIAIEFEDSGVPYDPLDAKDPDISLPVEERQIGGLGLFMVKNIMDTVEYRREGVKNILIVKKKLDS